MSSVSWIAIRMRDTSAVVLRARSAEISGSADTRRSSKPISPR